MLAGFSVFANLSFVPLMAGNRIDSPAPATLGFESSPAQSLIVGAKEARVVAIVLFDFEHAGAVDIDQKPAFDVLVPWRSDIRHQSSPTSW